MLSSLSASAFHGGLDNVRKENALRYTSTKTPGRALKGRAGLQENALHQGFRTADPQEKRNVSKTPFRHENINFEKDAPISLKPQVLLPPRPLADKTPLPNRQLRDSLFTPLAKADKIGYRALPSLLDEPEPDHTTPPPSSARKKLRVPRSSSRHLVTPITKGDHWNVSDISIEMANSSLEDVNEDDVGEPDYSDPEYMPPSALEEPYEPPFALPSYTDVGEMLMKTSRLYTVGIEQDYIDERDSKEVLEAVGWTPWSSSGLNLSSVEEEDFFGLPDERRKVEAGSLHTRAGSRSTSKTLTLASRSATTKAQLESRTSSRQRPATATFSRQPVSNGVRNSVQRPATALARPDTRRPPASTSRYKQTGIQTKAIENITILKFSEDEVGCDDDDFLFTL